MNAYELADELQELDAKLHLIDLFKSAVMLRQQADRIAELEKFNKAILKKGGYPHKPLSDEEMKKLINNFPIIFSPQDLLTFGRAIEERHGIK